MPSFMARAWAEMLRRWQAHGWYQLFLPVPLSNGVWNGYWVSWHYGPGGAGGSGERARPVHQDWGDYSTPNPQEGWAPYSSLNDDVEYATLRGGRFSTLTILNARVAVLEIDAANSQRLVRAGGALRLEMILDDNSYGHDADPIKARIFRRTVVDDDGRSRVELYVMRRVMAVRMTDQDGNRIAEREWAPETNNLFSTTPYFLVQRFELGVPDPWPAETSLLDQKGRPLTRNANVTQLRAREALADGRNTLVFPTRCSDPEVRTDPFTYQQETTGRTNRMSVADLACLARPFHCRQSRYLKRYLPGGGYVEEAKRQMLRGGMLEPGGVPEGASPLPSLAGLRL